MRDRQNAATNIWHFPSACMQLQDSLLNKGKTYCLFDRKTYTVNLMGVLCSWMQISSIVKNSKKSRVRHALLRRKLSF